MSDHADAPTTGRVLYAAGQATVVRIPVPGTRGLCIEFVPRGWVPSGGSTSTLFIQDTLGKRQLRLDYGYNVRSKAIDYHWNQSRVYKDFGIVDHATVGSAGVAAYRVAKYFRYAGRVLFVVGIAIELLSVVQAVNHLRRASEAVGGLVGAWLGCKVVGAGSAVLGTAAAPGIGTAVGGVAGCIVGGVVGYEGGSLLADSIYDWGEGARFAPLPLIPSP